MNRQDLPNSERVVIGSWKTSFLLIVFSIRNPKVWLTSFRTDIAHGWFFQLYLGVYISLGNWWINTSGFLSNIVFINFETFCFPVPSVEAIRIQFLSRLLRQLLKSYLDHYQKDWFYMISMFLLEHKHDLHIFFPHYLWDPYVWKIFFCILYHVLPVSVYMNETNPFMCCYDISAVALSECLALCNLSSGVIFKYYHLQCPKCHGLDAPFCKWCYMVLVLKYL